MLAGQRLRVVGIGTLAVVVAIVAIAFALGGSSDTPSASHASGTAAHRGVAAGGGGTLPGLAPAAAHRYAAGGPAVGAMAQRVPAAAAAPLQAAAGTMDSLSGHTPASPAEQADSSVTATRIEKTGSLALRVAKGQVQTAVGKLSTLATSQGGYVANSSTDTGSDSPSGEVTLRVPVDHFEGAVSAAEKLGHVLSLSTSAKDVTGHYVDLAARQHALERTRATYLTILSRATTIGATLSVQQRIDSVQQQIDQLHGQLKVLRNQTAYSTLTVDVAETGALAATHHEPSGIGKAWNTSWDRFARGFEAIVSAIGPLVLALLLIGVLGAITIAGYRGVRRFTRTAP